MASASTLSFRSRRKLEFSSLYRNAKRHGKKPPDFEVMKDAAVILNVSDLPTVIFHQLQNEHAEN